MNKSILVGMGFVLLALAMNASASYLIPYSGSWSPLNYPNNPGAFLVTGSYNSGYGYSNSQYHYLSPYGYTSYVRSSDYYGSRQSFISMSNGGAYAPYGYGYGNYYGYAPVGYRSYYGYAYPSYR